MLVSSIVYANRTPLVHGDEWLFTFFSRSYILQVKVVVTYSFRAESDHFCKSEGCRGYRHYLGRVANALKRKAFKELQSKSA